SGEDTYASGAPRATRVPGCTSTRVTGPEIVASTGVERSPSKATVPVTWTVGRYATLCTAFTVRRSRCAAGSTRAPDDVAVTSPPASDPDALSRAHPDTMNVTAAAAAALRKKCCLIISYLRKCRRR